MFSSPLDVMQLQAFEDDGAVLVDLRLDSSPLDRAEAAWDKSASQNDGDAQQLWDDPAWAELISAAILGEIAEQVLRSDTV